jgi:hypothetical protein
MLWNWKTAPCSACGSAPELAALSVRDGPVDVQGRPSAILGMGPRRLKRFFPRAGASYPILQGTIIP